jgi:hypothetical protein
MLTELKNIPYMNRAKLGDEVEVGARFLGPCQILLDQAQEQNNSVDH